MACFGRFEELRLLSLGAQLLSKKASGAPILGTPLAFFEKERKLLLTRLGSSSGGRGRCRGAGSWRGRRGRGRQLHLLRALLVDAARRAIAEAYHVRAQRENNQGNGEAPGELFEKVAGALHAHEVGSAARAKLAAEAAAFRVLGQYY